VKTRILIADDDPVICRLLELILGGAGHETITVGNGHALVEQAQQSMPDLLLIDLMMPEMDGFEALRQIRNDTRTAHIPAIIVTARSAPADLVTGFETGADDYITKPFNQHELIARVQSQLRRAAQRPVRSPLTGLPGNILITEEIRFRIQREAPFALLYVDINNFKAFNDIYGFARGDQVIKLLAEILIRLVQPSVTGDFVGHIGGDDFAVLCDPEPVETLCNAIIDTFNKQVRQLYDLADIRRGYLISHDRQGGIRQYPLSSLAIGGVTNLRQQFSSPEEVGRIAAEMKQYAKSYPNSRYAIDARNTPAALTPHERRGTTPPILLLVTPDDHYHSMVHDLAQNSGWRVRIMHDLPHVYALIDRSHPPDLIVADGFPTEQMDIFAHRLAGMSPRPDFVARTNNSPSHLNNESGVRVFLTFDTNDQEVIATIMRLISRKNTLQ
jgi:DNA-binding response OmpR family regulator